MKTFLLAAAARRIREHRTQERRVEPAATTAAAPVAAPEAATKAAGAGEDELARVIERQGCDVAQKRVLGPGSIEVLLDVREIKGRHDGAVFLQVLPD